MRQIKYRGYNKKQKRWAFGSLVETNLFIKNKPQTHTRFWIVESAFGNGGWFNIGKRINVDEKSVGQYTGLKDCKDVEIYEGDIFFIDNKYMFVEYIEDRCRYILTTGKGYDTKNCIDLDCDIVSDKEVIGNIYENKNLLGEV